MADIAFLAATLAFFVAAWAYVRGCERITAADEPDGEGSR